MKTISCSLSLIVLLVVSGCDYGSYIRTEKTNYSPWSLDRINKKDGKMEVSELSIEVIGDQEAEISGTVSCFYTEIVYDKRSYDNHHIRTDGTSISRRTERRRRSSEQKKHYPQIVKLWNPYGPDIEMVVDSEGKFSGRFKLNSEYYFKNLPPRKPYYGVYKKVNPSKLRLSIDRPRDYPDFGEHRASLPKFTFIRMNTDKAKNYAKDYAKSLLCRVTLSFKEQITRRSISPQITITPLDVPTIEYRIAKFKTRLESEFAGDEELVDLGMKSGKPYLDDPLSKTKTDTSQTISFTAGIGTKYKIETVHGEFNYFRGFITPSSSKPIDKLVLLVEKGEKIRMQEVREGEGGSMVDSD